MQYIYTQSDEDIRHILWTKYVLSWVILSTNDVLLSNVVNGNSDDRIITLDNGNKISIANMFLRKNKNKNKVVLSSMSTKYKINEIFDNFIKAIAAYHNIISIGNLSNNEYARKIYENVLKNFNKMSSFTREVYKKVMIMKIKIPMGIKTMPLNTIVNNSNYNKVHIRFNNFSQYLPIKNTPEIIDNLYNNSYRDHYNYYYNEIKTEIKNYLITHNNNIDQTIKYFYDKYVKPSDEKLTKWNNDRIYDVAKTLENGKCTDIGLNIKDETMCSKLIDALIDSYDYDNNKGNFYKFLKIYLDPSQIQKWPNTSETLAYMNNGKFSSIIAYRILKNLGFNLYSVIINSDKASAKDIEYWLKYYARDFFNDDNLIELMSTNNAFINFITNIVNYVKKHREIVNFQHFDNSHVEKMRLKPKISNKKPNWDYDNNKYDYDYDYDYNYDYNYDYDYDYDYNYDYDYYYDKYNRDAILLTSIYDKLKTAKIDIFDYLSKYVDADISDVLTNLNNHENGQHGGLQLELEQNKFYIDSSVKIPCDLRHKNRNNIINLFKQLIFIISSHNIINKQDMFNLYLQIINLHIYWGRLLELSDLFKKDYNRGNNNYHLKQEWAKNYIKYKMQENKITKSLQIIYKEQLKKK